MNTALTGRFGRRALHDPPLLRAHAGWIALVTSVVVLSACFLPLLVQGQRYTSEAEVLVGATVAPAVGTVTPTMETEVQIITSAAVLAPVANETGTPQRQLQRNLAVTAPPESAVLVVRYTDAGPARAQRRAQAVADAYVTFRRDAASVLTPATRPRSPSSPDYLLNATAGLVLGLLLGVGSALVRDRIDDGVRGPQDVERRTGLPVLTTVATPDPEDPATAEAYRILRTKVERGTRTGGALLVTVAGPEFDDGAGPTAEGLAVALARAGATVVLVDADLRAAAEEGRAGEGEPGLADVLRGHTDLSQALRDGPVPTLRRLGPGRSPEGLEDLLGGPQFMDLLQRLRAGADHVVVHVAPIVGAAETLVVIALADLTVLSAVLGVTTRAQLAAAVAEVRGADACALGWVLHDTDPELAPAAASAAGEPREMTAGQPRRQDAVGPWRTLTDDERPAGAVDRR